MSVDGRQKVDARDVYVLRGVGGRGRIALPELLGGGGQTASYFVCPSTSKALQPRRRYPRHLRASTANRVCIPADCGWQSSTRCRRHSGDSTSWLECSSGNQSPTLSALRRAERLASHRMSGNGDDLQSAPWRDHWRLRITSCTRQPPSTGSTSMQPGWCTLGCSTHATSSR